MYNEQLVFSMNNNDNNNRIPELRFPGFTGEWDFVNGDILFESISNKNHNSDLPILALTQDQGAVPRELINYNIQVSEKSVESYKVVDIDDFIISLRSFQGGIEYSKYKGLCSPAYIVLRKKNKNVVSDFYRHYFKSFKYIQDLNKNLEGIRDGKMISFKQFSEIQIPFPSPIEQQKIAECLSSLDEEIAAEAQKADALKDHKKGLMQQLFPAISNEQLAMSNCVPKLRFPGFEGEWVVKKLGDICTFQNGYAYNSTKFSNTGPYVIRISDIQDGIVSLENSVHCNTVVPDVFKVEKGDILIAMSGATTGKIGEYQNSKIAYINQRVGNIKPFGMNKKLLLFILQSNLFTQFLNSILTVGAQPNISSQQICSLTLFLPPTLAEQQKIADCLSELDEMISAQQQKVEALKEHKKGLMQKLFPKMSNTK